METPGLSTINWTELLNRLLYKQTPGSGDGSDQILF